jgi:hypothetical protein
MANGTTQIAVTSHISGTFSIGNLLASAIARKLWRKSVQEIGESVCAVEVIASVVGADMAH